MKALDAIRQLESGDMQVLKFERWLLHLALTNERNVNIERLASLSDRKRNYTMDYVKRSLEILDSLTGGDADKRIVEEALKWAEVAKAGLPCSRGNWEKAGCNLAVHNEGSARIYLAEAGEEDARVRRAPCSVLSTTASISGFCSALTAIGLCRHFRRKRSKACLPSEARAGRTCSTSTPSRSSPTNSATSKRASPFKTIRNWSLISF